MADFEPGPLEFLVVSELVGPIPDPDLEAFVRGRLEEFAGGDDRIGAALATMADDLAHATMADLDAPLMAAAAQHAAQLATPDPDFGLDTAAALTVDADLAALAGELPPVEGGGGVLSPGTPSDAFEETDWNVPPTVIYVPTPGGGGGSGGGSGGGGGTGDSGEGGGGGARPSSPREWLELYMAENPNERPRIERFLTDNDGDYGRAPDALELPGWAEFVRRHS